MYYWAEILEATDPDKAVQLLVEQEERLVSKLINNFSPPHLFKKFTFLQQFFEIKNI